MKLHKRGTGIKTRGNSALSNASNNTAVKAPDEDKMCGGIDIHSKRIRQSPRSILRDNHLKDICKTPKNVKRANALREREDSVHLPSLNKKEQTTPHI